MLTDQELLRYSRQILLAQVDIDGQLRLKHSKALIVGLGGLGSPVALYLLPGGWLLLEHGYDQADAVRALLAVQGFTEIASRKDLGGHERISLGRLPC